MTGQFFIIGALFICILLFSGMAPQVSITRTETADMNRLGDNMQKEMPHALNIGINSSDPLGILYNFTVFSIDAVKSRRINLECYWLVFQPAGANVNVTAGNFMASPKIFAINVSGTVKTLYVENRSVNSTLFSVSGYKFDVAIAVDDDLAAMTMLTNKTSIYSGLALERTGNVVRKEILA